MIKRIRRLAKDYTCHPRGPQVVTFYNSNGNHDKTFVKIAIACTFVGPLYIWRNITNYQDGLDAFRDKTNSCTNDFDYDLYNGYLDAHCASHPHQRHGIKALPIFAADNGPGEYALAPRTLGFDAGMILPNFNDNYHGNVPDMGAVEASSPPMEFGVNAFRESSSLKKLNPPPTPK
jgi:hypothetical protein